MDDGVGVYRQISSVNNPAVKEAARLARKRHRYDRREFLIEGEDLLEAALRRGVIPRQVFLLAGFMEDEDDPLVAALQKAATTARPHQAPTEVFECTEPVMAKLSELSSGSRIVAVCPMIDRKLPPPAVDATEPFLYLAGIGDPGNVGTLMRSAAALGVAAVFLGPGTADPYSPKSLRATMGAIFQVPFFLTINPEAMVGWAERGGMQILCADAHEGSPVWSAPMGGGFVLVLGSERGGIPRRLLDATAHVVRIPQAGETESINVAMAGTAILYESLRQREAEGIC